MSRLAAAKKAFRLTHAIAMEARSEDHLPTGPDWWYEPKWDGFRCLVFRQDETVVLQAKSGKPLTRYFPEVVAVLAAIPERSFALDGELLIPADGCFSFEALQMRLHPAESRIRRLAAETPAVLAVFDMLQAPQGEDLRAAPLRERRAAVSRFVDCHGGPRLILTQGVEDRAQAQAWLDQGRLEGVVAKRLDAPYLEGERVTLRANGR